MASDPSPLTAPLTAPLTSSPDYYKDYYDLLGLSRNDEALTPEKIKKAFIVKAMIWHPDKAPTEADKPLYTKMYEELQKAYKTLSNEDSRRQYAASNQTTNIDLVRRNVDESGYERSAQYMILTESGLSFDRDAFIADFENTRAVADKQLIDKAETVSRVTTTDYQKFISERDSAVEISNIFQTQGSVFNPDLFNKAFEYVKKNNPSKGVEECIKEPLAMGLAEADNIHTGVNFETTIGLAGSHAGLDIGISFNPTALDLEHIKQMSSDPSPQEQAMSATDAKRKLEMLQKMRSTIVVADTKLSDMVWSSQNI